MNAPKNSSIYISGVGFSRTRFRIIDSSGREIFIKSKRKFFYGVKVFLDDIGLQYIGVNLTFRGKLLLLVISQIQLFKVNSRLAISDLLFGHEISISKEFNLELPIRVESGRGKNFWISRSATNEGVAYNLLGMENDYLRLRESHSFAGFIWEFRHNLSCDSRIRFYNGKSIHSSLKFFDISSIDEFSNINKLDYFNLSNSVIVHGELIVNQNRIIAVDYFSVIEDVAWPTSLVFRNGGERLLIAPYNEITPNSAKAIFFGSSSSWYHFLVEIFPRFLKLDLSNYNQFELIVRGNLPATIIETLNVLGFRQIRQLNHGQILKIDSLLSCHDSRYSERFDLLARQQDLFQVRDFLGKLKSSNQGPKFICIIRKNNLFRKIRGILELHERLLRIGFVLVDPEKLSLVEQINLFSGAKVIVAESGAALTNIMFATKDCKVIEIHPEVVKTSLWTTFGSIFGIKVDLVACKPVIGGQFNLSSYDSELDTIKLDSLIGEYCRDL